MKNRTTTLIAALALGTCTSISAQKETREQRLERAGNLYTQGLTAMRGGKYDTAITSFREVVKLYPKHTQARRNLLHLLNNRKSLEVKKRQSTLKRVVIPTVDLEQVSVQEAVTFLSVSLERETQKGVTSNFIVQDPTNTFESRNVTLRLKNIPADTLLNYIASQADGIVKYSNHAIILAPRNPKKAESKTKELPSIER